jgi:hypothetical protein
VPKQSFAFEPGGEKRLVIEWKGMFKDLTIKVDGVQVGLIPDQKALVAGKEIRIKDGSKISVQLVSSFSGSELQVLRNGKPLPGSESSPEARVRTAAYVLYFLAALGVVAGMVSLFYESRILGILGVGWYNILFGAVYLILGLLVSRNSIGALVLAVLVFSGDALSSILLGAAKGYEPSVYGLLMRVFFLIPLVQGSRAIVEIRKR